jgi:hypothetical protein
MYGEIIWISLGGEILDVAQDVASTVLGCKIAKVGPKTHVCRCRLSKSPLYYWDVSEQDKAFSIYDIIPNFGEI